MTPRQALQPTGDQPYARLEPLVAALLERGSALARQGQGASAFGPSPEGYIAVLTDTIDWEHLTERFALPADIRYDAKRDVVLDDANWTAVYGSSGSRAREA
jgi:hypothetical protein